MREAIDAVSAGRTLIVIAHRLSTVIDSDRIVVVEDGHVIGEGTHAELVDIRAAVPRSRGAPIAGLTGAVGVDPPASRIRENPGAFWGLAGMGRRSASVAWGSHPVPGSPSPFPHGGPP